MKTVAFHTFGCKVNQYETEELRSQLRLGGFQIVPMEQPADVVVINSCSVTADADSSCRQLVRKVLREQLETRVVVTGCYAERAPDELRALSPRIEVFGNHEKPLIAMALGVPTACVQAAAEQGVAGLTDRVRAYIKIQDGCDAHCTYCIIPTVRPNLICRPPELILKEAAALVARGYKEIVLTGVRLGRYVYHERISDIEVRKGVLNEEAIASKFDSRTSDVWSFSRLVESLVKLAGDFRLRLSSIEVTEIPDSIIALAATNPKLCPFFHIPLQSGDDEILKRMGRWYTVAQYRARIQTIKKMIPDVALSADVIVGFAGEDESHFQRTVQLLEEEGFSRLHAFRYSIRPGTPAEKLSNHVEGRVKSERTRALVKVDHALRYRYARRFLNRSQTVLQESGGTGYTERYIRMRTFQPTPDGSFQTFTPTAITDDAVLIA